MILWFYDYRHCREQHWSMACFGCSFEGWNAPFKAGGASLFSPQRTEGFSLSHSESKWWLHSSYVKCHLGAKQLPSKQCWFWGFLLSQPLLVLASKSSFPLRNNHSIWSIHCRFLRLQMQRTHYFCYIHFVLREVLGQEDTEMCAYTSCIALIALVRTSHSDCCAAQELR